MEIVRQINEDVAIAGQITADQLQQLALEGFQAVLNLRSPDEPGFLATEQQQIEQLGLKYLNLPLPRGSLPLDSAALILQAIQHLPKPVLLHCETATRAAAIALIYVATRQGVALQNSIQRVEQLGLLKTLVYD